MPKLAVVVNRLAKFAVEWKDEATLGYSKFQNRPAIYCLIAKWRSSY